MKHLQRACIFLLSSFFLSSCSVAVNHVRANEAKPSKAPTTLRNGGFESGDLGGWTVEYGDAYSDDSVSSVATFSYDDDPNHTTIPMCQEGNWYLSGKGFDGKSTFARTGAIRSEKFTLTGDGTISMKLGGGCTRTDFGEDAPKKADDQLCYVGIYTAKDDKLVAKVTNEYFMKHTEDYVPATKYGNGTYGTENLLEYTVFLFDYLDEEMYIRIVDNDRHIFYGYLSVDDIRIGGEDPQAEGAYYVKEHDYDQDVEAPSIHDIKNGGFETGSLAGWTVLEGLAFSNEGVNAEPTWWNECITYEREGNYHYGLYRPSATGRMRSSTFVLGGSGYVSFKLGGCANNDLTYLSFYILDGEEPLEVARYSNRKFWNFQFPYVANGMKLLNMIQYVADLTPYLGKTMYIEAVDNNPSTDDLTCMTLDSVVTYHEKKPGFYNIDHYDAISMIAPEIEIESEYQVENGTFETGDLSGWEVSWETEANRIGYVSDAYGWWNENFPYNKKGQYLFTGVSDEVNTGYLKSSTFKVGGIDKMSFLLGGARDPRLCYVGLYDAETDEELAHYGNRYFHDIETSQINKGCNLLNMVQYVADLSAFHGKEVYLKVVDEATSAWGLLAVDGFITYYEDEAALPESYYEAVDILKLPKVPESEYQVKNGDFETGDLTGWTASDPSHPIADISFEEVWWYEWYSLDHEGIAHLDGWAGGEANTGTLTSESFLVGGQNKMSFRLGGGKSTSLCRVELIDAETEDVVATYGNYLFNDVMPRPYVYTGAPTDLSKDGVYMANMVQYVADLSEYEGRNLKIRLVDDATGDWGLLFADSFITYYPEGETLPEGHEAR